jgi:hypothetical protein
MTSDELFKQPLDALKGLKSTDQFAIMAHVGGGKISDAIFRENKKVFEDVLFDKCADASEGVEKKDVYVRNVALLKLLTYFQIKDLISSNRSKYEEMLKDPLLSKSFYTFLSEKLTTWEMIDLNT